MALAVFSWLQLTQADRLEGTRKNANPGIGSCDGSGWRSPTTAAARGSVAGLPRCVYELPTTPITPTSAGQEEAQRFSGAPLSRSRSSFVRETRHVRLYRRPQINSATSSSSQAAKKGSPGAFSLLVGHWGAPAAFTAPYFERSHPSVGPTGRLAPKRRASAPLTAVLITVLAVRPMFGQMAGELRSAGCIIGETADLSRNYLDVFQRVQDPRATGQFDQLWRLHVFPIPLHFAHGNMPRSVLCSGIIDRHSLKW